MYTHCIMYIFQALCLLLSIEETLKLTELYLVPETKWVSRREIKMAHSVRILEREGKGQTSGLTKHWVQAERIRYIFVSHNESSPVPHSIYCLCYC